MIFKMRGGKKVKLIQLFLALIVVIATGFVISCTYSFLKGFIGPVWDSIKVVYKHKCGKEI